MIIFSTNRSYVTSAITRASLNNLRIQQSQTKECYLKDGPVRNMSL